MSEQGNSPPDPTARKSRAMFFETAVYRRNRLIDAACVLPAMAGVLFVAPALLAMDGASTAPRWIFFFAMWIALIAATALLSRALRRATRNTAHPDHTKDDVNTGR